MGNIEVAMLTSIKYRWNTDKLFIRANEVSNAVYNSTGLILNKSTQLFIRKSVVYREKVFGFLACENRVSEIPERAKKHGRTEVEYVSYLFGIKPRQAVAGCEMLGLDIPTKFKKDASVRASSVILKEDPSRGNGDCVIRAIAMALEMPYDNVLTELEKLQKTDPTKGVYDLFWVGFLYRNGWEAVKPKTWKQHTLHTLVDILPELKTIPMIIGIPRHLFYFNGNRVNVDTWDAAYHNIKKIIVKKEHLGFVENLLISELSIEGLVHKLINYRKQYPNTTWNAVYDKMGLKWYDGQNIRRSAFFHMVVKNTEQSGWILNGKPKPGDEIYP